MKAEIVLADDLTGAGDSGIHFALSGRKTALLFDRAALSRALAGHQAAALSSESRFLAPEAAAAAVGQAVRECRQAGAEVVFKKIDSTLRGNPGAELEALLAVSGHQGALVCSAMPKTGRTMRDGKLHLHGAPLHETELGRDPFNPVASSAVREILAGQTGLPSASIPLSIIREGLPALRREIGQRLAAGIRVFVPDAETDADLAVLGELLRESRLDREGREFPALLPVGAGGLAEAFVGEKMPSSPPTLHGPMLAVIGSLTRTTEDQVARAAANPHFCVLELDMDRALTNPAAEIDRLRTELPPARDRHVVLKNRVRPGQGGGGISTDLGERAAAVFGAVTDALCAAYGNPVLYVTGGSTAVATAKALGLHGVTLERECLPGVVLSSCARPGSSLAWFITKAGGFGNADTLLDIAAGIEL